MEGDEEAFYWDALVFAEGEAADHCKVDGRYHVGSEDEIAIDDKDAGKVHNYLPCQQYSSFNLNLGLCHVSVPLQL